MLMWMFWVAIFALVFVVTCVIGGYISLVLLLVIIEIVDFLKEKIVNLFKNKN